MTTTKLVWPTPAVGFDTIGWGPEGDVFFSYGVAIAGQGYTASAVADLDGNTTLQAWGYAKPNAGARVPAVHADCGVATLQSDNQVGPCDALIAGGGVFGQPSSRTVPGTFGSTGRGTSPGPFRFEASPGCE